MRTGEAVVAQLARWGVGDIFGLSGSSILPILDALRRQDSIHYWTVRHEESAAFMASAYNKVTGQLGVCLAHAGPGAAHLINGLYDAHKDGQAVLAITGQVPTGKIGTSYQQSSNESLMFAGCTGYSRQITAPSEALDVLVAAMRHAICMNDVAHVAIPSDLLAEPVPSARLYDPEPYSTPSPSLDMNAVDAAARVIDTAQNPVILMGRGAMRDASAVAALAEHLNAPIITTLPAKGALPETHPLVIGPLGEAGTEASTRAARAADVLLVLGSTWWPAKFLPTDVRVVQVDVSATAIGSGHPVAVGIVGRVGDIVAALHAKLPPRPGRDAPRRPAPNPPRPVAVPAHPSATLALIRKHLPDRAIIAVDTGLVTLWYGRDFTARRETTLVSGRWRSMGFAVPAALAAQIAQPGVPVVALTGDGGFAMTGMEFASAVQHRLPIKVVVFNNGLLGEEAAKQETAGMPVYGMKLTNPDFAAFAEAAGGAGFRPRSAEDLDLVLGQAIRSQQPALVDVPTLFAAPPTLTDDPQTLAQSVLSSRG